MTHIARKRSEGFMRIIHLSESKPAKLHAVADVYFRLYLPSPIGFRALTTHVEFA